MASVTHAFVSAVPDDPVAAALGEVLPQTHWNAQHVVTGVLLNPTVNTQTSSYTLALTDAFNIVEMSSAGANTLTVPTNAAVAFAVGTKVQITQVGTGATTVAGAGGVTVHNADTIAAQWGSCTLYKRNTNEWVQTVA